MMKKFLRKNLPFDKDMKEYWDLNGFLVIENFYTDNECNELILEADDLVSDFDPNSIRSIFDTRNQEHVDDRYFLESGDKIRFFLKIRPLIQKEIY